MGFWSNLGDAIIEASEKEARRKEEIARLESERQKLDAQIERLGGRVTPSHTLSTSASTVNGKTFTNIIDAQRFLEAMG